jgi:16S rRNA (cytidine1402-2'-O)-methyltransferase
VCRELTKLYEEVWTGTLDAAVDHLAEREPRGEYVVVVDAAPPAEPAPDVDLLQALQAELAGGATRRDAARTVAERFGVGVNRVKRLVDDGDD